MKKGHQKCFCFVLFILDYSKGQCNKYVEGSLCRMQGLINFICFGGKI